MSEPLTLAGIVNQGQVEYLPLLGDLLGIQPDGDQPTAFDHMLIRHDVELILALCWIRVVNREKSIKKSRSGCRPTHNTVLTGLIMAKSNNRTNEGRGQ
jgi:hypothetical protein